MKILVLGGGAQGRVIAADLARSLPHEITVADVRKPSVPAEVKWVEADASDREALARLIQGYDLAVGALPSRYGFGAMEAAIEAGRPLVDVSFAGEDPLTLVERARKKGVAIAVDCGLAPGLSHLLCGDLYGRHGAPEKLEILVGGVAQDKTRPYGYVVTWSLDDLVEEYTRPARIVRDGKPAEVPVFTDLAVEEIEGVGPMESFLSDGLRTLIDTLPGVHTMEEKTLRWPGHVAAIQPLLANGTFLSEFRAKCVVDPPADLVALVVRARWKGGRTETITMTDRYDPESGLSAMARTTAFTTSVIAQLAARGGIAETGVLPPERLAKDPKATGFVISEMEKRGVRFRRG